MLLATFFFWGGGGGGGGGARKTQSVRLNFCNFIVFSVICHFEGKRQSVRLNFCNCTVLFATLGKRDSQ